MDSLNMPPLVMAGIIFLLRIVDVSLGTMRTITVVQGRVRLSVLLGFFEVFVWLMAISQVLGPVTRNPLLMLGYAAGFASGNAAGILFERKLALGGVILRIITVNTGEQIATMLRERAERVTIFEGQEGRGRVTLLYVICRRRSVQTLLDRARSLDPNLFFAIEPLRETSAMLSQPLPFPTGWRAVLKMK